jgi:hypothetical protein
MLMLRYRSHFWTLATTAVVGTAWTILAFAGNAGASSGGVTITTGVAATQNISVTGTISKGSGTFVIDHPLDPKNKLLYHSFVESPDVKNLYDGVATLNDKGEATIELPDYFLALNRDFRYLATGISGPMPNLHLKEETHRKWFFGKIVFSIAGGTPAGTISWQVTGIRHDPFIEKNPILTEVEKSSETLVNKGECIFEPLCK